MEKPLTIIDLNRAWADFLRSEEQEHLENRRDVPVIVIEPSLEVLSLTLKSWKMSKGLVHVVIGGMGTRLRMT
ncbi:hypothetical protein SAY87_026239 [Trapa incisa]|uniref:Uncharacterized protein n=1 Tax=Trapa incisa TaxID=236973 RepID=A0AAN7JK12_9MYRT|nr:hypothetical protein SAY87_026239 [Trapa incisa]